MILEVFRVEVTVLRVMANRIQRTVREKIKLGRK